MNLSNRILFCIIVFFLYISQSRAQISIINSNEDVNAVSYGQVKLVDGKDLFMVSRRGSTSQGIEVFTPSDTRRGPAKVAFPFLPMFMLSFQTTDLVIGANSSGAWYASKLSPSLQASNLSHLRDFESVSSAIAIPAGYMIGGTGRSGNPLVVRLDKNLVEMQRSTFSEGDTGEAVVVGHSGNEVVGALNLDNGKSSIVWLSNQLAISRSVVLKGSAASAVLTEKGIAITYSMGKSVVFEYLSRTGQNKSNTVLFQRDGPSSLKFQIVPIKAGFGVIGANKSALMFVKVDESGAASNIVLDKSGLLPPIERDYSVISDASGIHVLGIAFKRELTQSSMLVRFHALIKTD